MSVSMRAMRWWDLAEVLTIEHDVFGADGWSEPLFWSELAHRRTRCYVVAEDGGSLVGYAGLAHGGETFVQTIAVRRDRWGQGIGSTLLAHLLGCSGDGPVLLEVRADDDRAQALYRRFGFRAIGRRRHYYQPSGTDAVVMRRG